MDCSGKSVKQEGDNKAIWLVPSAEQTELDQLVTDSNVQTGELVYNETSNSLQLGFNDGGEVRFDDVASQAADGSIAVSYTHLRAHETGRNLVCRLLLEKKKK